MHIHTKLDGIVPDKFVSLSENKLVNFMEEFYQKCPVKPEEIDYVETYGCGIKVGNFKLFFQYILTKYQY